MQMGSEGRRNSKHISHMSLPMSNRSADKRLENLKFTGSAKTDFLSER